MAARTAASSASRVPGIAANTRVATGFAITDETRVDVHLDTPLFTSGVNWERTFKNRIETPAKIPLFGPAYFKMNAYDTRELRQRQLFSTKNLQITSGIGSEL